jgi:hypothetical protein
VMPPREKYGHPDGADQSSSPRDLRKLRKYGILSAKTEPNIFGDNAVPRSKGG